jgi:hypothetical protein
MKKDVFGETLLNLLNLAWFDSLAKSSYPKVNGGGSWLSGYLRFIEIRRVAAHTLYDNIIIIQ